MEDFTDMIHMVVLTDLCSKIKQSGRVKYPTDITTCKSRPTRLRRSADDMWELKLQVIFILAEERPMTVRQVFYQLVSRGWIDKTEGEYKNTVVRLLGDMRRAGELPFDWIADNTRWQRKPDTHASLQDCLDETAKFYRRSMWLDQPAYVEIWLEKEALAGVVLEVTEHWDVPLMVTRGYPSISFLHTAGEFIADVKKPTFLYYFGDLDPSGLDISRKVKEDIVEFANGADITFERVAITHEQVEQLKLPTRPRRRRIPGPATSKASPSKSMPFRPMNCGAWWNTASRSTSTSAST